MLEAAENDLRFNKLFDITDRHGTTVKELARNQLLLDQIQCLEAIQGKNEPVCLCLVKS